MEDYLYIHFNILKAGSGSMSTSFEVQLNQCGTVSSGNTNANGQPNPAGSYVESTIIVQVNCKSFRNIKFH